MELARAIGKSGRFHRGASRSSGRGHQPCRAHAGRGNRTARHPSGLAHPKGQGIPIATISWGPRNT